MWMWVWVVRYLGAPVVWVPGWVDFSGGSTPGRFDLDVYARHVVWPLLVVESSNISTYAYVSHKSRSKN